LVGSDSCRAHPTPAEVVLAKIRNGLEGQTGPLCPPARSFALNILRANGTTNVNRELLNRTGFAGGSNS
jgi:hypothetical protein